MCLVGAAVCGRALFAQGAKKVDFGRDVQPLLKSSCYGCHGPKQQMNNFRLDRRKDALRGGTLVMIAPGSSEGSRLYHRLVGNEFGMQMPPTGALNKEQIDIIKAWIDQGAVWPDDLAGETPPEPPDQKATQMAEALRAGDRAAARKILSADAKVANRKGPGGSTPLMYAVLYGNAEMVGLLLKNGADPNIKNNAGATALMWAADDAEKTRLLLEHHADANAKSDDARTPLLIAAGYPGNAAVVKMLLDHGANPSARSAGLFGEMTPLTEAAYAGDATTVGMLIDHGADAKAAGYLPLYYALRANCAKCFDLVAKSAGPEIVNIAMTFLAPPLGDASAVQTMLDHGADPNTKEPGGYTILMQAASSDVLPVEIVKTLIARGADINAKSAEGLTALDLAKLRGQTPVVDLLAKAGAKETTTSNTAVKPKPASSARAALDRSIPLLQKTDATFIRKAGCISCHNNTFTAMTVAAARKSGVPVQEESARKQVQILAAYLDNWRERALQGIGIPGDSDTVSYILLGLAAGNHQPDLATDAMARYVKSRQSPDGRWIILAHRPPIEASDLEVTAASMRSLQLYAPKAQRAEYQKAVDRAASWIMQAHPQTTEDRVFQILGMAWAGAPKEKIQKAANALLAEQRPDGGWSQIPSLASDAYATGEALVALRESGAAKVTDAGYQRGTQFLLNTQLEDGSWYVKSRAIPIQPYFESDFPHGHDQWISASATNWASQALAAVARQ
ncbi:MAG TPA: ankyrin repeat domain-containing protein [Bryobacteraceae bacterium]|nr:ankyrin repeat domain-containing protein [Bryobacteraceae bacterium]